MDDADVGRHVDVGALLATLRRRRWVIAGVALAALVISLAVSVLQDPVYQSSTSVLLDVPLAEKLLGLDTGRTDSAVLNLAYVHTEMEVMRSQEVRHAVEARLGHPVQVSVAQRGDANVVTVSARSGDRHQAQRTAKAFADVYRSTRRAQLVADLTDASQGVQSQVDSIDKQIAALAAPLEDLRLRVAAAPTAADQATLRAQQADLEARTEAQRSALQNRRSVASGQLDQLRLATNLTQRGGAQIISPASLPDSPTSPKPLRDAALATVLGLLLGIGAAFVLEQLDDRVNDAAGLAAVAPGVALLATIPNVERGHGGGAVGLVSSTEPTSPAAEAHRMLRTALDFAAIGAPTRVVLITSPAAGEGKTTTAVNLAVALSGADRHVVVVDCDLRRPRVHEIFDLPPDPGFTSLLLGRATLTDAVHIVATQERLAALPSGPVPPNPSELLASRATEVVLQSLRSEADAVIIDSPPVLPVTDALVLGRLVDGVVVVVRAGKSTKKELRRTLELLRLGEVRVLGLVLNGTREDRRDHYRYSYVSNGAPGPVTGGGAAAL